MPDHNERLENMLFPEDVTGTVKNKRDFLYGVVQTKVETYFKEKPKCVRIRPPPLKYFYTMSEWKSPIVPMDLFVKPKDVVHTNPRRPQQAYERPPDLKLMQVRKTRPRLVMTPTVSIDDMPDEEVRQTLLKNIYKATAAKSMEEVAVNIPINNVQAPFPEQPSLPNPFVIPPIKPPYVSPEWRMDTVTWDKKNLRTYCSVTKDFWLNRQAPKCRACREFATMKAYRAKQRQTKSRNH